MAGSGYQSADLLTLFNEMAGRPASGDAIADTTKYQYLADAQQQLVLDLSTVAPQAFPYSLTAMTTADSGYTWTFGTDADGYPLFPLMGKVYQDQASVPAAPWVPGIDYLDEGDTIRMPNNVPWDGTLYWYGVAMPQRMSGTVQPVLQLPAARYLVPILAASQFSRNAGKNVPLADTLLQQYQQRYGNVCTAIRKHLRGPRALRPLITPFGIGGGFSGAYSSTLWG